MSRNSIVLSQFEHDSYINQRSPTRSPRLIYHVHTITQQSLLQIQDTFSSTHLTNKMQFFTTVLFAITGLASLAASNSVEFVNQDSTERTIIFTAQAPLEAIPSLTIPPLGTGKATFPQDWIGNWYSVSAGAENKPGMLGEVRFNGFAGHTFFDVSAIVDPNDHNGVKMIMPKNFDEPVSGCQTFPCANAYNKWDDIATQSTADADLVCLIGNLSNEKRRIIARMPHEFVTV